MTKLHVTAVFFDWDMTLARILGDVSISTRLAYLFQEHGLPYTPADISAALERHYQNGGGTTRHSKPQKPAEIIEFYQRVLHHLGHRHTEAGLGQRLYEGYALLPNYLYDDVLPTLAALREKGLMLGIISNHSITARPTMESLVGALVAPENIVISDEVGLHKPDGRIFTLAADTMRVQPDQCVLVGDNFEVDAVGAVTAGGFAHGFWLDRKNKNARELPEYVKRLTRLDQLLPYF